MSKRHNRPPKCQSLRPLCQEHDERMTWTWQGWVCLECQGQGQIARPAQLLFCVNNACEWRGTSREAVNVERSGVTNRLNGACPECGFLAVVWRDK